MLISKIKQVDWFLAYIYFYLFVIPWHFSKSQISILSVILLVWTIIKFRKEAIEKCKKMITFTPILLLLLFITYTYISVLWSDPIIDGFKHVSTFSKYYLLFIPAILISLNKKNSITGIKVLIISFGCYSIYSILIYLGFFNSTVYGFQPNNPTGHLRYLISTQYMIIAFFSSLLIMYYSKIKEEKFLFLFLSLVSFFALFINNSRTSQFAFLIILLIFLIIYLRKYVFNIKIFLVFIFVLFSGLYFLYENDKLNRFQSAYKQMNNAIEKEQYTGSLGVRLYFDKVGISILKDNVLFGTGPKDNRILLQEIQKNDPNYFVDNRRNRILNHFHNEHIDTLTAYGVVGYLLLISSIIFLIFSLRKQPLYYYLSLVVFLSLFLNSLANKTLSVKPLNYVYIIFFVLFAIIAFKLKEDEKVQSENNS